MAHFSLDNRNRGRHSLYLSLAVLSPLAPSFTRPHIYPKTRLLNVIYWPSRLLSSAKHLIKTKMRSGDGASGCVRVCRRTVCIFVLSRTYRWSSGASWGKTKRLKLIATISSRRHDSVRLSECAELLSAQLVWEFLSKCGGMCARAVRIHIEIYCVETRERHTPPSAWSKPIRVYYPLKLFISYKEQFGRHAAATLPHRHQIQMRTQRETNYYNNKWSHARCAHNTDLVDVRARGVGGSVVELIRQYAYRVWMSVSNRTMFRIENAN